MLGARSSGDAPDAGGPGGGVVTWESRGRALCIGELSPAPSSTYAGGFGFGGGGPRSGASLLQASRQLALLPQETVLQARMQHPSHLSPSHDNGQRRSRMHACTAVRRGPLDNVAWRRCISLEVGSAMMHASRASTGCMAAAGG